MISWDCQLHLVINFFCSLFLWLVMVSEWIISREIFSYVQDVKCRSFSPQRLVRSGRECNWTDIQGKRKKVICKTILQIELPCWILYSSIYRRNGCRLMCYQARSRNCEERLLASSWPSDLPSTWNNSDLIGRILMKFDIWDFFFFENL